MEKMPLNNRGQTFGAGRGGWEKGKAEKDEEAEKSG